MEENINKKIEMLKNAKKEILESSKGDLVFSRLCLSISPITPILMTVRNGYFDADKVLLNYLIIGLPLIGLSAFFRYSVNSNLVKCNMINKELETYTSNIDNEEFDKILNSITKKEKEKILRKD